MENNTCLLVHSKDCYADTTQKCIEQLYRHGFCHRFDVYVSTEHNDLSEHRYLSNIQTGDGIWSDRLTVALAKIKNSVQAYKNVIFFLEDMIVKNVNVKTLSKIIDFHNLIGSDLTKLGNHPFFTSYYTGIDIDGKNICKQPTGSYLISHQPVGIWNIDFLLQTLDAQVTPWEHETKTNDRLLNKEFGNKTIITVGSYPAQSVPVGGDYGEIIEYHHLLSKGEKIPYIGKYND